MERKRRGADVSPLVELSETVLESIKEQTKPAPIEKRPTPRPLRELIR